MYGSIDEEEGVAAVIVNGSQCYFFLAAKILHVSTLSLFDRLKKLSGAL